MNIRDSKFLSKNVEIKLLKLVRVDNEYAETLKKYTKLVSVVKNNTSKFEAIIIKYGESID